VAAAAAAAVAQKSCNYVSDGQKPWRQVPLGINATLSKNKQAKMSS